jgi:ABC-type bacteriocin/lantibiotic exporter with double-glycine peptidase domain
MHADSPQKMAPASAVFREYWSHTVRYPWLLVSIVVTTILVQVSELVAPLYLRRLFNVIASGSPSPETAALLFQLVAIIGGIALFVWALRRAFGFGLMYFELCIMRDLLDSAFSGLLRHSYHFFISRFAGSLTHKVNKFSRAYETMADAVIMQFVPTLVFVVGAVTILYIRHPLLGTVLGGWAVVFLAFQLYVAKLRQPLRVDRAERETQTTGALAENVGLRRQKGRGLPTSGYGRASAFRCLSYK